MDPVNVIMTNNYQSNRLEFASPEKTIDIAQRIIKQDSSCLERFEFFILKYFTRTWVVIKDKDDQAGEERIMNINSVAKRTGLKRKVIKQEIKADSLFAAIKTQVNVLVKLEADEKAKLEADEKAKLEAEAQADEPEVKETEAEKEVEVEDKETEAEKEVEVEVKETEAEKEVEVEVKETEAEKEVEVEVKETEAEKEVEVAVKETEAEKEVEVEVEVKETEEVEGDYKLEDEAEKALEFLNANSSL